MMTTEEVAEIITYCEVQKISYKTRLQELNIPLWKFYDAKRKHISNEDNYVLTPQIAGHNLKNKLGLIKFGNNDNDKKKIYT